MFANQYFGPTYFGAYFPPVFGFIEVRFDPKAQFPKYGPTWDELIEADDEDIINVIILATIFGVLDE